MYEKFVLYANYYNYKMQDDPYIVMVPLNSSNEIEPDC